VPNIISIFSKIEIPSHCEGKKMPSIMSEICPIMKGIFHDKTKKNINIPKRRK
jgi:hypothetical protein